MNRRVIAAAAAALVLAGASFGAYRLGQRSVAHAPAAAPESGRKVLYWQDPMAPGKRFDKPGKSPYMDMDLVPVYADEQGADGTVKVSPDVQQNLGIRFAEVRQGQMGGGLRLVGNIAFNERERVLVQARSSGFVERLYVRAPLERVRKGQALLDLYVPDWVAAQEEYLSIRRMGATQSAGLLEAAQQRMRLAGMTDEQIRQVAARGQVIKRVTVTAPATGVVSELPAREGMTVSAGAPMMTISGLASVWVNAEVPENAAAQVRPGTAVGVTTPAYPGERFSGKVESLLPQVDPSTRTLVARIEIANPAGKLSPGMFANISVTGAGRRQALVVPSEAVIQTGTRTVVIVAQGDGKFMPMEVSVGTEANGDTEILSGLSAGQRVVASGQFLIDSEASLRGAVRRLEGATQTKPATVAPATHHGIGKIEKIGPDEVTISHGPIQTLGWGPMTMGFVPPAGGLPAGIRVGDSVAFDVQARPDGRYQIMGIERKAKAAPPPAHEPAQHGSEHGADHATGQGDAAHGEHGAQAMLEEASHEHGAHQ
ncbi:efflux RND transporter periplasmic adaptor subunit [Massilia agilis]|uniref:Efflux RND transporter periplasmic adaptor subunit n=1 Tax=Massilia agilis TaxID=1811226 RepID=A0ABT2D4T8_9BURK|nr:efflux RND transporter periplasmic adaptor subunit [Massilia agilis]MCS0806315.1 efflux RND transporter periplasmic adaptor subunit [Massilia agilis]